MKLNEDCVRDIMLYLEEHLTENISIKVNQLYPILSDYSYDDIDNSALIILDRNLAKVKNDILPVAKKLHFSRITDKGYKYLDAVRDDNVWNGLKKKFKTFLTPDALIGAFEILLKSNGLL